MTAPRPALPACLSSQSMQAILDSFSPAGPMHATLTSQPWRLFRASAVCLVSFPQRSSASFTSTVSLSMNMYEGFSAFPTISSASYPACFSSGPMEPPMMLSASVPVAGDFAANATLPPVPTGNPSNRPPAIASTFLGSNASTPLGTPWYTSSTQNPWPPRYLRTYFSSKVLTWGFSSVRSTLRILPV